MRDYRERKREERELKEERKGGKLEEEEGRGLVQGAKRKKVGGVGRPGEW